MRKFPGMRNDRQETGDKDQQVVATPYVMGAEVVSRDMVAQKDCPILELNLERNGRNTVLAGWGKIRQQHEERLNTVRMTLNIRREWRWQRLLESRCRA